MERATSFFPSNRLSDALHERLVARFVEREGQRALPRGVRVEIPAPGAVALTPNPDVDPNAYTALGYPVFGTRALRADIVEGIHAELAELGEDAGKDGFELPGGFATTVGLGPEELPELARAFAYVEDPGGRWRSGSRSRSR